jgi:curved DNA-binding protein CbpA
MTTVTILDEVLETVLLVILATDPSIIDWLIFASTYAMRAASKPAVKRTFAALLIFAFFLLATISIPTDPALEFNSTTPYGLLGVTTTSSSKTITTAYDNLVHETKDSVLISTLATSKLEAYQAAHKTLTDPLQRCLYHRDNKVPDWYGVPKLCWGEMLVDKLQAAKGSIRVSADAKAPLKETRAAMRKLRGLPDGAQETESKPAEKSKSAKSTPQSNPTESLWARMPKPTLTSVQQSLNGTKEAIITLPAKMKQYIRVMFRILQLSILVIFPAAVQRWLGRIKATLEFLSHKIMALLKMVSPRKPLTQLWNTVLTTFEGLSLLDQDASVPN